MNITRFGMFETNSSSTHAIVVAHGKRHIEDCFMDKLKANKGKKIYLTGGYYGRGYSTLHGAKAKLNYIATHCFTYGTDDKKWKRQQVLRQVVREQSGLEIAWIQDEDEWAQGIDHQSYDNIEFENAEAVRNIIYNPNIIIEIYDDAGDSALVDMGNYAYEYGYGGYKKILEEEEYEYELY